MIKLSSNQILIKSFSYPEKVKKLKKKTEKKLKGFSVEEVQEDIICEEDVEHTHAIIYLIDQNRFWYYNIIGDEVEEKHHTKNGLFQSVKILDEMYDRFTSLHDEKEFKVSSYYSIFSDQANHEQLDLITNYTNLDGRGV